MIDTFQLLGFLCVLLAIVACKLLPELIPYLRHDRRIERRLKHGQCLSCGYDLRASSARCPECGARIRHGRR